MEDPAKLTLCQLSEIVDLLTGYADGEQKALERFDLTIEEVEDVALNNGLERCPTCDCWVPAYELVDDDNEVRDECEDCRK